MAANDRISAPVVTCSSPESAAQRRAILRALVDATSADCAIFHTTVEIEGKRYYVHNCVEGDAEVAARASQLEGKPVPIGSVCNDDPRSRALRRGAFHLSRTPAQHRNRFRAWDMDLVSRELAAQAQVFASFYNPLEIGDQLRTLVFAGPRFLGWVGLLRRGASERFKPRELAAANAMGGALVEALLAAEASSSLGVARHEAEHAVLTPQGRVELATPLARRWLSRERMELLARVTRRLNPRTSGARALVDGALLAFTPLDGVSGERYLVTLRAVDPVALESPALTARQRRIAELAAAGATADEIAQCLGVSRNTVKFHLKEIYRRLEVANRLELAARLGRG